MEKKNTVEKGDDFELRSLGIIQKVIEEEQLGHLSKHLRVYTKNDKGYYSSKRKKEIKFDITIEVWPPGAERFALIYIIECKNNSKRVPVDDIEEFHSKVQQVSGVNVKAIFISNAPLQEGGYNIAESVGMMWIQGESSEDYKIVLHKRSKSYRPKKLPIVKSTLKEGLIDTGVELVEKLVDQKLIGVFNKKSNSQIAYKIDRLSKEDIEKIANFQLDKINPGRLENGRVLSTKTLTRFLKEYEGITIVDIDAQDELLGKCDIENKIIGINKSIKNTNRELFILGHEYGHFILHQRLSIGQMTYESFDDSEYNFRTRKHDLKNPKNWIEWQANFFSSSLVLPKPLFMVMLWKCQDSMNMQRGKIHLDDQYYNIKAFRELIRKLAYRFDVSQTTVIFKLKEMGLINDQSRMKSIGQIIEEYKEGLVV